MAKVSKLFHFKASASTSDEYLDLLDQACLEYVSWCGEPIATLQKAIDFETKASNSSADTLLAQAFTGELMLGVVPLNFPLLQHSIEACKHYMDIGKRHVDRSTIYHAEAVYNFTRGDMDKAQIFFEKEIEKNPYDMFAIKSAQMGYYFLGKFQEMKESIERVFPTWEQYSNTSMLAKKCFGFLCGMYAFALEETLNYDKAQEYGRRAIEMNPYDVWAIHALAHIFEMKGMTREGIQFLESTVEFWDTNIFSIHIWWHLCLLYLDTGNVEKVKTLYRDKIRSGNSFMPFDLVDAAQLLWRLELVGETIDKSTWQSLVDIWRPYQFSHHNVFFQDLQFWMSILGAQDFSLMDSFLQEINKYAEPSSSISSSSGAHETTCNQRITWQVGIPLMKAFKSFRVDNKFDDAFELMFKHKNEWINMGASNAQRDFLMQTMISAGMKCGNRKAEELLNERIREKPDSYVNNKLMQLK